ncbi:hypothetical protein HDU96_006053 [Phlyctochytrium bullatum]|nr:hypothetical protein HDU96_006053 [Phlyctochytrium bullatum]
MAVLLAMTEQSTGAASSRGENAVCSTKRVVLATSRLPLELWSRIFLEASHSLKRLAEITSACRTFRNVWRSPAAKAEVLVRQYGVTLRHRVKANFLGKLPDREAVILRLLKTPEALTIPAPKSYGDEFTWLHLAACQGLHRLAYRLIVTHGIPADVRSTRSRNPTPLFLAIDGGDLCMVALLLALGANPVFRNDRNETPLSRAALAGQIEIVRLLAEGIIPDRGVFDDLEGAAVTLGTADGWDRDEMEARIPAAILSCRRRGYQMGDCLYRGPASHHFRRRRERLLAMAAGKDCSRQDVDHALETPGDGRNRRQRSHPYLLMHGGLPGLASVFATLRNDDGAALDSNGEDHDLSAALFAACTIRDHKAIKYFITLGADPNIPQQRLFRWRPLHQLIHSFKCVPPPVPAYLQRNSGISKRPNAGDAEVNEEWSDPWEAIACKNESEVDEFSATAKPGGDDVEQAKQDDARRILLCVKTLLDLGANPLLEGVDGTPAAMARRLKGLEEVTEVLENGGKRKQYSSKMMAGSLGKALSSTHPQLSVEEMESTPSAVSSSDSVPVFKKKKKRAGQPAAKRLRSTVMEDEDDGDYELTGDAFVDGLTNEDIHSSKDLFSKKNISMALDDNVVEYRLYPNPLYLLPSHAVGRSNSAMHFEAAAPDPGSERKMADAMQTEQGGGESGEASGKEPMTSIEDLAAMVMSFVAKWTSGHIWHKEPLFLRPVVRSQEIDQPYLKGKTKFGDCIDDEWFIVFLLKEITKEFPHLIASVSDNDGDFLLIEAALHIPANLDPTNSTNRIFLYQGRVHLIPLPTAYAGTKSTPSPFPRTPNLDLRQALKLVRNHAEETVASKTVQEAIIKDRCDAFPDLLRENRHRVRCLLPRELARALQMDPGLVSAAVEAFYLRDAITMRPCESMNKYPPSTNVPTQVLFTRTLYAQLVSNPTRMLPGAGPADEAPGHPSQGSMSALGQPTFVPPKAFRGMIPKTTNRGDPHFKAFDVGMRLACGFEMLAADVRFVEGVKERAGDLKLETYQFEQDPDWRAFKERLTRFGYFKNELPGSKLYKSLERTAREQYLGQLHSRLSAPTGVGGGYDEGDSPSSSEDGSLSDENVTVGRATRGNRRRAVLKHATSQVKPKRPGRTRHLRHAYEHHRNPLTRLLAAIRSAPDDDHQFPSDLLDLTEDSDTWMEVEPATFEAALKGRGRFPGSAYRGSMKERQDDEEELTLEDLDDVGADFWADGGEEGEDQADAEIRRVLQEGVKQVGNVVESVKKFVSKKSGLRGALFLDEADSDDEDDDPFADSDDDKADDDEGIGAEDKLKEMIYGKSSSNVSSSAMDEDEDENAPVRLDSKKFFKAMMSVLGVDESVMKPKPLTTSSTIGLNETGAGGAGSAPSTSSSTNSSGKLKKNAPLAPPASFDPAALLTAPAPARSSGTSAVTQAARLGLEIGEDQSTEGPADFEGSDEDEEDEDVEVLERKRLRKALRSQRRDGVQEIELDSDEENELVKAFDKRFLENAEREDAAAAAMTGTALAPAFTAPTTDSRNADVEMGEADVEHAVVSGARGRATRLSAAPASGANSGGAETTLAEGLRLAIDSDDESDIDMSLEDYMAAMDLELKGSKIGRDGFASVSLKDKANTGSRTPVKATAAPQTPTQKKGILKEPEASPPKHPAEIKRKKSVTFRLDDEAKPSPPKKKAGWGIGSSTPNKHFLMGDDDLDEGQAVESHSVAADRLLERYGVSLPRRESKPTNGGWRWETLGAEADGRVSGLTAQSGDREHRVIAKPTRLRNRDTVGPWEPEDLIMADECYEDRAEEEVEVESGEEVDEEEVERVRLDARMVQNLLESFKSQQGLPGPASNLLGRLGGT